MERKIDNEIYCVRSSMLLCYFSNNSSVKYKRSVAKIKEEDRLYNLCQTYMSVRENGDGYWLTVTELDMYDEINQRHEELGIREKGF